VSSKKCPRCGQEYSYLERHRKGGRVYVVAVHYEGYVKAEGKVRKKVRKCYLGPEGSYDYVSRLHAREGLVLRGASDHERALAYLDALISYLASVKLEGALAERLAERFLRLAWALRGAPPPSEVKRILEEGLPINFPKPVIVRGEGGLVVLEAPYSEAAEKWRAVLEEHGFKAEVVKDIYGYKVKVGLHDRGGA